MQGHILSKHKIHPLVSGARLALRRKIDHSVELFADPRFKSEKEKELKKLDYTYVQGKIWKRGAKNAKVLRQDESRIALTIAMEDLLVDCAQLFEESNFQRSVQVVF